LIGDINFFLKKDEEDGDSIEAEVNIMIGEADSRRKGLAKEALLLGFRYVIEQHKATSIIARISDENIASISLFETKLQWKIESHSDVFGETTFKSVSDAAFKSSLEAQTPDYRVTQDYEEHKLS
jgi:hypothetical protein